jgi:rhodanese-related sulfurtransferase
MIKRPILIKIILISAFIGLAYNYFSKDGIGLLRKEIQSEEVAGFDSLFSRNLSADSLIIKTISLETAYKIFQSGDAIFIDGRDKWDYSDGHIPQAINLPEYKIDEFDEPINLLDKNGKYVVYCSGEDCDASKILASVLMKKGFKYVIVYPGGFDKWAENNYPVEAANE